MSLQDVPDSASPAPAPAGAHQFAEWLTVQEAVAYCLSKGLHRTPKTIRKWALRSQQVDPSSAEVVAKPQDTEFGFRWLIERVSLDVKIAQELEFEARKTPADGANLSAQVHTGVHHSTEVQPLEASPVQNGSSMNLPAPAQTGAQAFSQVQQGSEIPEPHRTGAHHVEPVHTSADGHYVAMLEKQLERAHQQLDVKDRQIESLLSRDQETNILIQGLQRGFSQVIQMLPGSKPEQRDQHTGDSSHLSS